MLELSVIIPTYNRPEELENCICSILNQTLKPGEVIIVDDGALDSIPLESRLKDHGISVHYLKKKIPGLTESRNAGIKMATKDIITFLDDDVVLDAGFFEQMMSVFENDFKNEIGGVDGLIVNQKPMTFQRRLRRFIEILFLNSGFNEGKILRSGFFTGIFTKEKSGAGILFTDFLSGCCMSYRKTVFEHFKFTDRYRDFGFGEDKDFSYRVSRKFRLVTNKRARLQHLESIAMRPRKRQYGKKVVMGRYHFFRDYIKQKKTDWFFFYYALLGYFLIRATVFLFLRNRDDAEHLRGVLDAVTDIWNGRVL